MMHAQWPWTASIPAISVPSSTFGARFLLRSPGGLKVELVTSGGGRVSGMIIDMESM